MDSGFSTLSDLASAVIQLKEMHHFYPVLFYFRFEEAYYSVSLVTSIVLDCASLLESATDAKEYEWLQSSGTLGELWSGSLLLLDMNQEVFGPANRSGPKQQTIESDVEQWRHHYLRSLDLFKRVGIQPAPDVEQGASQYIELRTEWAHKINGLAQSMLYPTEKVDPDRAKEGRSGRVLSFRTRSYPSPHQIFRSKEK